jgi:antitoxin ParD1/3/4
MAMSKPKKRTMNISLTPELADFIERKVASGLYTSNSEVVREALRQYGGMEVEFMPGEIERIKEKLAEAEEDVKAGRVGEWDVNEVFENVLQRMRKEGKTIKP